MAVQVKGTILLPRWKYLQEKGAPDQVRAVLALLAPDFRVALEHSLMLNQWYPFEYFLQIARGIDRVLGRGDLELLRDMAHYAAENALNTVYKVFFKLGSPEYIIKKAGRLFSQYFSSGQLQFEMVAPKKARAVMEGFETPSVEHCLTVQYWMEKTLLMTGVQHARVDHTRCRMQNDHACEFIASWE